MNKKDKEIACSLQTLLQTKGAAALSDAQLMTLIVHSGDAIKDCATLCTFILKRAGTLSLLSSLCAAEMLASNAGLSLTDACALEAAFELGRRACASNEVKPKMDTSAAVVALMRPRIALYPQEKFCVLLLDVDHCLIDIAEISVGTLNASMVHMRDVFREAVRRNAHAFIAVHNHTGDDPSPSVADRQVTKRLMECSELIGVKMLDHIIVTKHRCFSFLENALL